MCVYILRSVSQLGTVLRGRRRGAPRGGFKDLSDADIVLAVAEIIREAIVNNGLYYDVDDAEDATQEILPAISLLNFNPRFSHIRKDYNMLVELVTYLTVQLA
ncbi:MAG: hypothetical protein SNH01_01380 [Rikenellaceae bacterium]